MNVNASENVLKRRKFYLFWRSRIERDNCVSVFYWKNIKLSLSSFHSKTLERTIKLRHRARDNSKLKQISFIIKMSTAQSSSLDGNLNTTSTRWFKCIFTIVHRVTCEAHWNGIYFRLRLDFPFPNHHRLHCIIL